MIHPKREQSTSIYTKTEPQEGIYELRESPELSELELSWTGAEVKRNWPSPPNMCQHITELPPTKQVTQSPHQTPHAWVSSPHANYTDHWREGIIKDLKDEFINEWGGVHPHPFVSIHEPSWALPFRCWCHPLHSHTRELFKILITWTMVIIYTWVHPSHCFSVSPKRWHHHPSPPFVTTSYVDVTFSFK